MKTSAWIKPNVFEGNLFSLDKNMGMFPYLTAVRWMLCRVYFWSILCELPAFSLALLDDICIH